MQVDLPVHDPPQSLYQTRWLVFRFACRNHGLQGGTRGHGKGALVDGLVARIQFWNDEVASCAKRQHASVVRIMVGPEPRESR